MNKVLIAEDPRSQALLAAAMKVANSKATVLITGETGVGKELLAHFIHDHSPFKTGPFVAVNCAALPDNMIEAILFGYEKGAFTGAINSHIGKFEQAQNGTLLLDEIAEIPLELQGKLLRVLQEREIEKLCGKKLININVRIIAATNRDLHQLANDGLFRKDLYYRLNVVPLYYPALRERPLDIVPLAEHFVQVHAKSLGRSVLSLSAAAKEKLRHHSWPGNVREMDNVMMRAVIMANEYEIDEQDIELLEDNIHEIDETLVQLNSNLKINEAKMIIDVLKEVDGCREDAAKKLNMSPRTLRYKISKLKSIGLKLP